jgi:protoporphyrinogen oxidase
MQHTDILIIGAGPTGLGAAWRLDAVGHDDWLLVEAEAEPGGLARSIVDEHGFTWDLGGHVQFSHYPYFDVLMDDLLGETGWLHHERESWAWVCERFVPYPFQLNVHRLPPTERDACVQGIEAANASAKRQPDNFAEWMDAAFGAGISRVFMRPYNTKMWARPPEQMSWRWIGDRVATVDLDRLRANVLLNRDDVSWGPNHRFRFPVRGGIGAAWKVLADRLTQRRPGHLQFRAPVVRLNTDAHEATLGNDNVIRYRRLLTTVPLDVLVGLSDLKVKLAGAASELEYTSTHVIGIALNGLAETKLQTKCWMYFPDAGLPFYRIVHFSRFSPHNVPNPDAQWSLIAEVSESPFQVVNAESVVEEVLTGLVAAKLIRSRAAIHHAWQIRLEHGYPVPSLKRDRALGTMLEALEARDVFSRGRFGAWKYEVSNQDHSFAQGVELVERWRTGAWERTLHAPEIVNARQR